MTETQKDVVLVSFVKSMAEHGSWCGETHIQKGTYILQELLGVSLGFQFVLYKHGPYSFDFKDELTAQMADSLLAVKPRPPYGASIVLGENSRGLLERFPTTRECFRRQTEFVASRLGRKRVPELERLATALFITRNELPSATVEQRAKRITELKPHVTLDLAYEAVQEADHLIEEARPNVFSSGQ